LRGEPLGHTVVPVVLGPAGPDRLAGAKEAAGRLAPEDRLAGYRSFVDGMDEARQIRGGGADALGAFEAPVFDRAVALRGARELRDARTAKTGRPESGVLQTGAVQDLALQELEEGRAAFALGG